MLEVCADDTFYVRENGRLVSNNSFAATFWLKGHPLHGAYYRERMADGKLNRGTHPQRNSPDLRQPLGCYLESQRC